jgi:hypothetical protein
MSKRNGGSPPSHETLTASHWPESVLLNSNVNACTLELRRRRPSASQPGEREGRVRAGATKPTVPNELPVRVIVAGEGRYRAKGRAENQG